MNARREEKQEDTWNKRNARKERTGNNMKSNKSKRRNGKKINARKETKFMERHFNEITDRSQKEGTGN